MSPNTNCWKYIVKKIYHLLYNLLSNTSPILFKCDRRLVPTANCHVAPLHQPTMTKLTYNSTPKQ